MSSAAFLTVEGYTVMLQRGVLSSPSMTRDKQHFADQLSLMGLKKDWNPSPGSILTQLDKVLILEDVVDGVIRVQPFPSLTGTQSEASLLVSLQSLGLTVASQGLEPQPLDRAGGVMARHPQPLSPHQLTHGT